MRQQADSLELAKTKLAELERNERMVAEERRRGKMLFGEAMEEYLRTVQCDATKQDGKTFLKAENPKYPDLIPAEELVIQDILSALIRKVKG